jgi:hypothetical protein
MNKGFDQLDYEASKNAAQVAKSETKMFDGLERKLHKKHFEELE